jgi:hypothetical protein
LGIGSLSSRSRLGTSSVTKKLMPVALPPGAGEAGDKTKLDRVVADSEGNRDRRGCSFAARAATLPAVATA